MMRGIRLNRRRTPSSLHSQPLLDGLRHHIHETQFPNPLLFMPIRSYRDRLCPECEDSESVRESVRVFPFPNG